MSVVDLALQNILSPMVLFFALGAAASLARSDLAVPEAVARILALYLLMSIGMRGGAEISHQGASIKLFLCLAAGIGLSFGMPFIAYGLLRRLTRLNPTDAAAVAGHYGSISAVTLAAVTGAVTQTGLPFEGYLIAVAAAMETPAILSALLIARKNRAQPAAARPPFLREVLLNGSVVMLLGAFVVGLISGPRGMATLKPFLLDSFPGFLSLFLLDMGLIAGRGLAQGRKHLSVPVIAFAILMPIIGMGLALGLAQAIGLSAGGTAIFMTLAASASYIAVPAAMRLALPEANPAIALTLSLGVTFPFNLTVGIPLYIAIATHVAG